MFNHNVVGVHNSGFCRQILYHCKHVYTHLRTKSADRQTSNYFWGPPNHGDEWYRSVGPTHRRCFRAPADPPPFFHSPSSYLSWNCQTKKWVKNQFEGRRRWVDPPHDIYLSYFFKYIFSHIKLPKIFFRNCWRHQIPNKHKNNDASWGVRGHWKI